MEAVATPPLVCNATLVRVTGAETVTVTAVEVVTTLRLSNAFADTVYVPAATFTQEKV